ncbi:hypothetical protein AALA13_07430 [Lachnospiraceae bacterium 50-23]
MEYKKIFLVLGASSDIGVELITQLNQIEEGCLFLCHYRSSSSSLNGIDSGLGNRIECLQADMGNSY